MKKLLFILLSITMLANAQHRKQYGFKGNVKLATEIIYNATYNGISKEYVKQDTIQKVVYHFDKKGLLIYQVQKHYNNNSSFIQMCLAYSYKNGIVTKVTTREKPKEIVVNNPIVSIGNITHPTKNKQVTFVTNKKDTLLNSKSIITLKNDRLKKIEMKSVYPQMNFNVSYSFFYGKNGNLIKTIDDMQQTTSINRYFKYDKHKNVIFYVITNGNKLEKFEVKECILKYY